MRKGLGVLGLGLSEVLGVLEVLLVPDVPGPGTALHFFSMPKGLFLNKVARLRPATLLKKRLGNRGFPVGFTKFLKADCFVKCLQ